MTKIVKIKGVKIYIFRETWWISMKLMMILKVTKNKALHSLHRQYIFLNIFLRLRHGGFIFMELQISFCRIGNVSFYLNKNEHRKKYLEKSLGKRYEAWYMFFRISPRTSFTYAKILAHVSDDVGNIMVIVEPCPWHTRIFLVDLQVYYNASLTRLKWLNFIFQRENFSKFFENASQDTYALQRLFYIHVFQVLLLN